MSNGTPEKLIPRRLDPRKQAFQWAAYSGSIPPEALPRLQEAVAKLRRVTVNLEFRVAEEGEKLAQGSLVADVDMVCQRCLEPVSREITSEFAFAAVWDEEEAKQLPKAYDPWITGEGEGDLYDILEEELLLSLPVVAFHDTECVDEALFSSGKAPEGEPGNKPNPFQVLKQLKGHVKK